MKRILKRILRKTTAIIAAATIGLALTVPTMPLMKAEALGVGDAIGIGVGVAQMSAQRKQLKKTMEEIDSTEEGRKKLYYQFREKYGVNEDAYLNDRLDRIMANLTKAVATIDPDVNNKKYLYFINKEASINAACSLGHVMMVNTGTFTHMSNDDEIAAVVGHEMGHGQKNHVMASNLKMFDQTMLAQIGVAAAGGSMASGVVGAIVNNQANAHTIKKNEWEADNMAFEYLQHTNYNLGACAAVMQRFVEIFGSQKQSGIENLLSPSDHPNSEARRDNYSKKLTEYSGGNASAKDGAVMIKKRFFVKPAATSTMSSEERSYFVLGNLAAAYHNGHNKSSAYMSGSTLMLGEQPIMTVEYGDEDGTVLVERLNSIK